MKRGKLSHLDSRGRARMVDVSAKPATLREATAEASVVMKDETYRLADSGKAAKGDVFAAARLFVVGVARL